MLPVLVFLKATITDADKDQLNDPSFPLSLSIHKLIAPKAGATKPLKAYQIYRRNYVAAHSGPNYRRLDRRASRRWFIEGPAVRRYFIFLQNLMGRYLNVADSNGEHGLHHIVISTYIICPR